MRCPVQQHDGSCGCTALRTDAVPHTTAQWVVWLHGTPHRCGAPYNSTMGRVAARHSAQMRCPVQQHDGSCGCTALRTAAVPRTTARWVVWLHGTPHSCGAPYNSTMGSVAARRTAQMRCPVQQHDGSC